MRLPIQRLLIHYNQVFLSEDMALRIWGGSKIKWYRYATSNINVNHTSIIEMSIIKV